jgi:hypothetical protein
VEVTVLSGCDPSGEREMPEAGDWELYTGEGALGKRAFNTVRTSAAESIKKIVGESSP